MDSEAVTVNSVGLPHEASGETEPVQGHVRDRIIESPSPANRERPRICLAESGEIAANSTKQSDNATASSVAAKKRVGLDEEDASPSLVTIKSSSTLLGSDPSAQEVLVQEERTPDAIPSGWTTRAKLEPFPANRKRLRTCLAESGQIAPVNRTDQDDNATGSCCSVEKDAGPYEEDPKPSQVTSSLLISSDPDHQEVVQEEATTDTYLPPGWIRTKLEPDC